MVSTVLSILVLTTGFPPSDEDILAQADARIREHRTREVSVKLLDAEGRPIARGTKISIEQTAHEFLFGCNIYALGRLQTEEHNAAYIERFAELFNFATLPFYWWSYERERGRPDHARTEQILVSCREHGIVPKGHPLAWNYVDPRWIPEAPGEVMDLQIERIAECSGHFRDKVMIWDVVNEAAHYDRDHVRSQAPRLTQAIDEAGVIQGIFSNGMNRALAQVTLAKFNNPAGLERVGNALFAESSNSGLAIKGEPGEVVFASISAGSLEMSNVDLAEEFVDMIVAQRGLQASARVLTTSDEMVSEVVNLTR